MGTFPRHNCFVCDDGGLDFKRSQGNKVLLLSVFFFIYVYECLPMCLYVHKVPVQEMTLDPLKRALQMPASHHTNAENQTQVLWSSARTASALTIEASLPPRLLLLFQDFIFFLNNVDYTYLLTTVKIQRMFPQLSSHLSFIYWQGVRALVCTHTEV